MPKITAALGQTEMIEYYSSWRYAAIHIACTIPNLRTSSQIARRLGVEAVEVEAALRKLSSWGLVDSLRDEWVATQKTIHLPKDHFMTQVNHANWRSKNLEIVGKDLQRGLLYSAVYSLSREDADKLQEMISHFLSKSRDFVVASPEEELVSFTMDYVRLTQR